MIDMESKINRLGVLMKSIKDDHDRYFEHFNLIGLRIQEVHCDNDGVLVIYITGTEKVPPNKEYDQPKSHQATWAELNSFWAR